MIPRTTRNGIILLSALSVLSFWISTQREEQSHEQTAGLDTRLDYALKTFEVQFYDVQGKPSMNLRAPSFSNNAATGDALVTHPVIQIMHDDQLWNIIADSATVTNNHELIYLTGGVNIRRGSDVPGDWLLINADDVLLQVTPKVASSDQFVKIIDATGEMEAIGFRVDMQKNKAGFYVPS